METYTKYVCDSILPLSVSGTLPSAFKEWHFTGNTQDNESPSEICQLCGKEEIRYQFEIRNNYTRALLQVGSHCILRFRLAVYDDKGLLLSPSEAKHKLDALTRYMHQQSCLRVLEKLAIIEKSDLLKNALDYYRKNKHLSPKYAFVVFWQLNKHKIHHTPSFFKVALRRQKHIDDLRSMSTDRVHFFWRALTSAQRQKAIELGHSPPTDLNSKSLKT